jgi:uncharacterized protein (DUF1697 family)
MPEQLVGLFRGINVGTAKRVSMAELRATVESLGYRDVRTLLNSGNLVFTAIKRRGNATALIERALVDRLGVSSCVTVLSRQEVADAIQDNPFARVAHNPSRLLVHVLRDATARSELKPLVDQNWRPERLSLGKRVAYLWCPQGIAKSALRAAVDRILGDRGTSRNIATMTKLLALCDRAQ